MKTILLAILAFSCSGCATSLTAYLERSTRTEPVVRGDNANYPALRPKVAGISVSSGRRMVISAAQGGGYYTCSEPPPDTGVSEDLREALAASAKATGTDHPAAVTLSDSVALTSILLAHRTELVELWRTTSYSYCLLEMDGDPKAADAYLKAAAPVLAKAANSTDAASAVASAHSVTSPVGTNPTPVVAPNPPQPPVAPPKPSDQANN